MKEVGWVEEGKSLVARARGGLSWRGLCYVIEMFVDAVGHYNFGWFTLGQELLVAFNLGRRLRFLGWVDKR